MRRDSFEGPKKWLARVAEFSRNELARLPEFSRSEPPPLRGRYQIGRREVDESSSSSSCAIGMPGQDAKKLVGRRGFAASNEFALASN